jgi:hypothetical protein
MAHTLTEARQGLQIGGLATLDGVRISDRCDAFADQQPTNREDVFSSYVYQSLYSYRPNQIYQGSFFFLLFRARQ